MDIDEVIRASNIAQTKATEKNKASRDKILRDDKLDQIIKQLKESSVDEKEIKELMGIIEEHSENNEKTLKLIERSKILSKKIKDIVSNAFKR